MIGELVAKLIASGTPPDVAAAVVAEAFAAGISSADVRVTSRDVTAERRRENDRIRQQRYRDNLRMSRDNPQTSQVASTLEEEKKEEIKQDRDATKSVTSRGRRLSDDWAPSEDDWQAAIDKLGPEQARLELAKFRDHWKSAPGRAGLKLDWDATFRNWIRNARGTPNVQRNFNSSRRPAGNDFFAGIASVAADIAGHRQPPGPADEEIPSGRINIDG